MSAPSTTVSPIANPLRTDDLTIHICLITRTLQPGEIVPAVCGERCLYLPGTETSGRDRCPDCLRIAAENNMRIGVPWRPRC